MIKFNLFSIFFSFLTISNKMNLTSTSNLITHFSILILFGIINELKAILIKFLGGKIMDIIHYEGNGFYIYDENKEILARLEYKRNDNVLIFDHTVVSDKLKGQGIAQKLLDEAVDYARKNNFKVHPVCSYVVKKFETGNYDDIKI